MEKRAHRLVTNPLLNHDDTLISAPHLLHTTQVLWGGYLAQGRLLCPGISEQLRQKVNLLAQRGGDDFEARVAQRLHDLGWPYRAPIPFDELTGRGLAAHGEIDALVADTKRRRIWLIEAKAGILPHAVDAIYSEVQRYHRPGGYLDHMTKNAAALQAELAAAAQLLGLAGDDWQIVPLMVTRHVSPAAYVPDPRVAFTVLDDMLTVLNSTDVPLPGHAPIGTQRR